MSNIIKAVGLGIGYRGAVASGIDFTVNDGDVLAVVGPNGSGKTTLLRTVLGIMAPIKGELSVLGHVGSLPTGEAEGSIAYIPQRLEIDRTFPITLGEMLALSTRKPNMGKYVEMLKLGPLLGNRLGSLSGGQMQKAMLAYAIIKEPRLLVMDEPTSWVDAQGADCVLCVIDEFRQKGIAIIVVTHDFSALEPTATHVLGLGQGAGFFGAASDEHIRHRLGELFGPSHTHGGLSSNVRFPFGGAGGK